MSSKNLGNSSVKTVWRNVAVAVFALCFALLGLCVTLIPSHATDDGNYTVGEIYGQHANVQQLYNLITGKTNATYADVVAAATTFTNSATMRGYNNGNDIKVTFGGKEWYAVYLSRTNETNPRPILTLWLCEPFTTAQWNQYVANGNSDYPSDLYGTSYIRALLNNGGTYATSGTELNGTYTPDSNYALKEFLPGGQYGDVVVTPSAVGWQEFNTDYSASRPNIFYGTNATYSSDEANYAKYKTNGDAWQKDNLWLPSYTYEGFNATPDGSVSQGNNLWEISVAQNQYQTVVWGRDGDTFVRNNVRRCEYIFKNVIALSATQLVAYADEHVTATLGVRPALHIDLSATALKADWDAEPADVTFAYNANEQAIQTMADKPGWYDPAMTITYTNADGATVTAVKDAGTYTATVQLNDMVKDITVTVTPQAVTVEGLKAKDKTYDGTQKVDFDTSGVKLTGSYTKDNVSIICDGRFTDKNVGEKSVPVTVRLTGDDADNYVLTNPELTLTAEIIKRTVTINNIIAKDKTYDGTATAFLDTSKIDYTNKVDGDDLTVAVTGQYVYDDQPYSNVGNGLKVVLTYQGLDGKDAGNYDLASNSQQEATGNITKRFITVTVNNQTVKVGDPLKLVARVSSGSLASGDNADDVYTLAIKLPTDAEFDVNNLPAGEYTITGAVADGDTAQNYAVTFANTGKYTVLSAAAWDALQTKDDDKKPDNNYWVVIVIVIAVAAFIGALVGIGLVVRSHDRTPKPVKEKPAKKNKKDRGTDQTTNGVTPAADTKA